MSICLPQLISSSCLGNKTMELATNEKRKTTRNHKTKHDQARKSIEFDTLLARDIALDILSKLPITSLIQFRYVNRSSNLLSRDPNLVPLHFSTTASKNPYLIFHCDYPIKNKLYFVELSDNLENKIVRKIEAPFCSLVPEFNLVASCDGLLCLNDSLYDDPVIIYNPFTSQYKELPRTRQYDDQEVLLGFGFSEATNDFKVVKISYFWNHYGKENIFPRRRLSRHKHSGSEVQVYSVYSNEWKNIGEVRYELERRDSESLLNGRLHWLTYPKMYRDRDRFYSCRRIVSFDLGNEKFEEIPEPDCGSLNKVNYHLAVIRGCLGAVVYIYRERFEMWVMREYNVKESWAKEIVIKDYSQVFINRYPRSRIWNSVSQQRDARLLCVLRNGNVLMEYKCGVLVCHDPINGTFPKKIEFKGMPSLFRTIVHVGGLTWIDAPIHRITSSKWL